MIYTEKIKIRTNKTLHNRLLELCNVSRFLYNALLSQTIKMNKEKISKVDCQQSRNSIRFALKERNLYGHKGLLDQEFMDLLSGAPSQIIDQETENVAKAWKNLKKHSTPSFKKKGLARNSFTLHKKVDSTFKLSDGILKTAKMEFDVSKTRFLKSYDQIKLITITQSTYGWYLSICLEIPDDTFIKEHTGEAVGIDWGVKVFASDSDGNQIAFQGSNETSKYDRYMQRLKQLQSIQGKKRSKNPKWKESKLYHKISNKVKHIYEKTANIRKNFLHQVTKYYVTSYDYIAIEDLKPSNLLKNHKLARSVSEAMFYTWKVMLRYKAKFYGVVVDLKNPRNTTQTCSCCRHILTEKLKLSQRTFVCESCGHEEDRDLNAAKNILLA